MFDYYVDENGVPQGVPSGSEVSGTWTRIDKTEIPTIVDANKVQLSIDESLKVYEQVIQQHIDNKARELRYDNINSIAKYLGYENTFKAECEKLGLWCANCWVVASQIENDVLSGNRTAPTIDQVIAELPVYGV